MWGGGDTQLLEDGKKICALRGGGDILIISLALALELVLALKLVLELELKLALVLALGSSTCPLQLHHCITMS